MSENQIVIYQPNEAKSHPFIFTVGEPPPEGFMDPEGNEIADSAVVEWLSEKGFTQDDIDTLGKDAALPKWPGHRGWLWPVFQRRDLVYYRHEDSCDKWIPAWNLVRSRT